MMTEPDFRFCGLSMCVDARQFPNASDYWDGNWLMLRVRMEAHGAHVECAGPILMTADIERFRDQLVAMADTLTGDATLAGLEPDLNMVLKMGQRGHVVGVVEITPDQLSQQHRFQVEAD
jgi:hypothetical protein